MMRSTSKDAHTFVTSVTAYLAKEKQSSAMLGRVTDLFHKVTRRAKGESVARVISAVPLTGSENRSLASVLSEILGYQVVLESRIDRSIICGLRISVGDWIIDTSFLYQLDRMATMIS